MNPLLALLLLLPPQTTSAHHPEPKEPPRCDRLSVCLIIDCDADSICLLPGLPLPPLPGLDKLVP